MSITKILTQKSYARVTLALDIIRQIDKGDFAGYHELNIIKHQIGIYDTITLVESGKTELLCTDSAVPDDSRNLCLRAVELLKNEFSLDKSVKITIEKNIPVKSGLSGGSSNAATTFILLNRLWNLGLSDSRLIDLGKKIGLDIPFYFLGKTAFDTESTGILEKIDTGMQLDFILVFPDFGVSTEQAYKEIDYGSIGKNTGETTLMKKGLENGNKNEVIENIHNDFELTVFSRYPKLKEIKNELIHTGCSSVMSGSGSTIIGIAKNKEQAEKIQKKLKYNSIITKTK